MCARGPEVSKHRNKPDEGRSRGGVRVWHLQQLERANSDTCSWIVLDVDEDRLANLDPTTNVLGERSEKVGDRWKVVGERPGRRSRQHIVEGGGHRFLFTWACKMAEIVADFLDNGASKANRQLRRPIPL